MKTYHLLYFYNPNCPHCKAFTPKLEENIANNKSISCAKIDVTQIYNQEICSDYEVNAVPQVCFFKKMDNTVLGNDEETLKNIIIKID